MDFLKRNTLPKFQERLDLAASDLNDLEEILCKAINELAGRIHIINNLLPENERDSFADAISYPIVDEIQAIKTSIKNLNEEIETIKAEKNTAIEELNSKYLELEKRLNALDDAAARKADLNVVLYRTGE